MNANTMNAHEIYRNAKRFTVNDRQATPHSKRPSKFDKCIVCEQLVAPEALQEAFKNEARKKIQYLKNKDAAVDALCELVDCGDETCPHKFHLACINSHQPIPRYHAQYLSMEENYGKVKCPDHFCEICFTESIIASSGRDKLIQVKDEIRAFHVNCYPAGASDDGERIISLAEKTTFSSEHFGICCGCGAGNTEELIKCSYCSKLFHRSCHGTDFPNENVPECEDCIFGTQIRKTDLILVQKENGPFLAASMKAWRRNSKGVQEVLVQFKNRSNPDTWVPLSYVCRIYPALSKTFFQTMKTEDLLRNLEDDKTYDEEWRAMSEHLEAQFHFQPNVKSRPLPKMVRAYKSHVSFSTVFGKIKLPKPMKTNKNIKIKFVLGKGYGVFAKKNLSDVIAGDYVGELVSVSEMKKRYLIGKESHDKEQKFYSFQSAGEKNDKPINFGIDAASHQNMMSFINTLPNCEVERVQVKVATNVMIEILRIRIIKVEKGKELTLAYNWTKFPCWCGLTKECKSALPKVDWAIPSRTVVTNVDNVENLNTETASGQKRKPTDSEYDSEMKKPKY